MTKRPKRLKDPKDQKTQKTKRPKRLKDPKDLKD